MKFKTVYLVLLSIVLFFAANSFQYVTSANSQDNDVVVIVSKDSAGLSKSDIKKIFTGKTTKWPGGESVLVVLNNDKSISEAFCKKYLGMAMSRLSNMWVKKNIREGIPAPRNIASNVIVTMIANSNKFIGFVKRQEAGDGVKIIE